jgi:hypothetical protein
MPRLTPRPSRTAPHYTRPAMTGEAANGRSKVSGAHPDAATQSIQPKEITMFRMFTTAAVLALSVTAAQAGDLSGRIHEAAVVACAPESVSHAGPVSHYGAITEQCIYQVSHATMAKYRAQAEAKVASVKVAND